jgi:hypothetical protein
VSEIVFALSFLSLLQHSHEGKWKAKTNKQKRIPEKDFAFLNTTINLALSKDNKWNILLEQFPQWWATRIWKQSVWQCTDAWVQCMWIRQ